MFCCCVCPGSGRAFTRADVFAQQPFDQDRVLYGCGDGSLFVFDFQKRKASFVHRFESAVLTIVSFQKDAFVGTRNGDVFIVPQHAAPQMIKNLGAAVTRLYIFGDGLERVLYAASEARRLDGFLLGEVRRSFSARSSLVEPCDSFDKPRSSSASRGADGDALLVPDNCAVQPAFSLQFPDATPTFLHGCSKVLAFCSRGGEVRFYSQRGAPQAEPFNRGVSFPISCCMHLRNKHGQTQLACDVGYEDGGAAVYQLRTGASKPMRFFETIKKTEARKPSKPHPVHQIDLEMNNQPAPQRMALAHEALGTLLDSVAFSEDSGATETEEKEATLEQNDVTPVQFSGGLRAIWHFGNRVAVADNKKLYLFSSRHVALVEESYVRISAVEIDESPNRLEFMQFGELVQMFGCYNSGKIVRGVLKEDTWHLQWVGK